MISFGRIRSQKGPSKAKTLGLGIRQLRQVYIRIVIKKIWKMFDTPPTPSRFFNVTLKISSKNPEVIYGRPLTKINIFFFQVSIVLCLFAAVVTVTAVPDGYGPKCRTVYETVYDNVCTSVYDNKCISVPQTQYQTR